jgi:hypothetical protein
MKWEEMICNYFGMQVIKLLSYGPTILAQIAMDLPQQTSITLPMHSPNINVVHALGWDSLPQRFWGNIYQFILRNMLNLFLEYPSNTVFNEVDTRTITENNRGKIWVNDGIYGYREANQELPSSHHMFPITMKSSMFRGGSKEDLMVPDEYSQFIDKFPTGTLMVGFGTTFMPTEGMINVLLEAVKEMPDLGFIFSIKESAVAHLIVMKSNLPNILLKTFVP